MTDVMLGDDERKDKSMTSDRDTGLDNVTDGTGTVIVFDGLCGSWST